MAEDLKGKKVAILLTDGFEQVEMTEPRRALKEAGAEALLVAPKPGQVQGWNHHSPAERFPVDCALEGAPVPEFDALMLPGGVMNPDSLRMDAKAVAFVKQFVDAGKPIAAICHGPWTLIETGVVRGKRMTSWPSLRTDLANAGAEWSDEQVVVDGPLVTSRKPDDLPAFNREMVKTFAQTSGPMAAA